MKILRELFASTILLLIFTSVAIPQNNQRENFQLEYWDSYVGSYQIEPGRFIVIGLAWNKKLSYLDTETGVFGTLEESRKDEFTDKQALTIRFDRGEDGDIDRLRWKNVSGSEVTGKALNLRFEQIKIPNGNITLAGTLILPETEQPYPVIIYNGGASWIVREQLLEDALINVSYGIAAVVFDKRGFGDSSGEQTVPFSESADDIVAIGRYLKYDRTDINPKQIGISTYSQSGWYGTLAASRTDNISFLILNVPSATFVYRQEFQRVEHELRADGFSGEEILTAMRFMHLMSGFSRTGGGWNEYSAMREKVKEKEWFKYVFAPKTRDPRNWQWGRMNWEYNPLRALARITAPTLVILGEHDKKVLPEVNRSIFEMAFTEAGNRDYTIKIIPDMNHSLVVSKRGGRKEETPNRLAPGLISTRVTWLQTHLDLNRNRP
jgi:pimeloyl-ACP methyl ester carboxylesterase